MTNIWSNNKYIEITINVLLFMLGINFMHLGQFVLPLICLLLFIDRRFKFEVNSVKIFVVLCLFALSFFIFSYKLGFYSVMGFTLPMSYYIGSNMYECNVKNTKYLVYILAVSMASYLVLNFFYELSFLDFSYLIVKVRHEDVWTGQIIRSTLMGLYSYIMIATIPYVMFEEKKIFIKISYLVLFSIIMIYNISLARRTMLLVIAVSFLLWFLFAYIKKPKDIFKVLVIIVTVGIVFLLIIWTICKFNLFGIFDLIRRTSLYQKFVGYGLSSDRINYLLEGITLAPKHLWGGQEISNIIGIQIHDLWSDIYDYSGIFSWLFVVIYTCFNLLSIIRITKNKKINKRCRIMFTAIYIVSLIAFCLEPIMTSSSIYMIVYVLFMSCMEKLNSLYSE